ncbi:MAG: tRNA lysidine(34) synthetase TilS [Betaproteobacteria bacterium]
MKDSPSTAEAPVLRAVRDAVLSATALRQPRVADRRIAIALSGGRDSMVLLDALHRIAPECAVALCAVHVHHGLSTNADAWAQFCAAECAKRGILLDVQRVRIERKGGASLEATARTARYAALATAAADFVALAHHADDQAETLLLQLMRGAGSHGLAAMPRQRASTKGPALLRPLLALPRAALVAYANARSLAWVDDESNANTDVRRNFIRHEIAPRLAQAFPGYPATLARSAAHQAEGAKLADELAKLDAEGVVDADAARGATLDRAALIGLDARAPHRARNLLRWFLRLHGLRPPSTARLAQMHHQLVHAAADARVRLPHGGAEVGIHRGRVVVHPPAVAPFALRWQGEVLLALPHGTLEFALAEGTGEARAALGRVDVTIRSRAGGERIRLGGDRPRQALKRVLHEAGMPTWLRDSLPLVFCGDALAVVPGVGVDVAFVAIANTAGYAVHWHPASRKT